MTATLDRNTAETALLTLSNGDVFEIYGADWCEMKADAIGLAASLGVEIEIFNSELPEA